MSEWINVKDRLPESTGEMWSTPVIALSASGDVFRLSCMSSYWQRPQAFIDADAGWVTHWMPLNEPED